MTSTVVVHEITHETALSMIAAAVAKATEITVPECIVIVDLRGRVIASVRMTGAKFTSIDTAQAKAVSAASNRLPSGSIPAEYENLLAHATRGAVTNLRGGLPIVLEGNLCGAVGVGSGSPDQDLVVARAALDAVGADAM